MTHAHGKPSDKVVAIQAANVAMHHFARNDKTPSSILSNPAWEHEASTICDEANPSGMKWRWDGMGGIEFYYGETDHE